jgi:fused signal recognition particle receptor
VARELGIPVRFTGVGEGLEDLLPFSPEDFVRALLGAEE